MSYHTSGSMRSYGGGYGTISIGLANSSKLEMGVTYSYTVNDTRYTAVADTIPEINAIGLIDSNYTLPDNPPPFLENSSIVILDGIGLPITTTKITSLTNYDSNGNGGKSNGQESVMDTFGQQTTTSYQGEQQQVEMETQSSSPPTDNPIVEINLDSPIVLPSRFVYKFAELAGEPYYGPYHKHQDGTLMIGGGQLNVIHDMIPEEIIIPREEFDYGAEDTTTPTTFDIDENVIKETFSDLVYAKWFSELDEDYASSTFFDMTQGGQETSIDLNLNTLQTTIRDGQITTGRQENETLVFFKKDRNTPENKKDLTDGKLSLVINNISSSFVDNGVVDLSEFISDKISVVSELSPDEEVVTVETIDKYGLSEYMPAAQGMPESFKIKNVKYKLRYRNEQVKIDVPFGDLLHIVNSVGTPNSDDYLRQWYYYEWVNVLNLSQLTTPSTGQRINATKAKEVLDTNIFELLPTQTTRQDQINRFFRDFNDLIGNPPEFQDVDNDGIAEYAVSEGGDKANRVAFENKNSSFITRLDKHTEENQGNNTVVNQGKTLETMRNTLNKYLADVDNVVEVIQDQRPEYTNKMGGFLKIRKPNQAIILKKQGDELEFQKNNRFLNGFTVTMWVRFVGRDGRGTLFNFGNPLSQESPYGFRLETITTDLTEGAQGEERRRVVRLIVRDHLDDNKLYESSVGTQQVSKWNSAENKILTRLEASPSSGNAINTYTSIPTNDLNEWFFICATYNATVDEESSFNQGFDTDKQFWLGHKQDNGSLTHFSGKGNRCKVEVISRSDLLRARGYKIGDLEFDVNEQESSGGTGTKSFSREDAMEETETQQEEQESMM